MRSQSMNPAREIASQKYSISIGFRQVKAGGYLRNRKRLQGGEYSEAWRHRHKMSKKGGKTRSRRALQGKLKALGCCSKCYRTE